MRYKVTITDNTHVPVHSSSYSVDVEAKSSAARCDFANGHACLPGAGTATTTNLETGERVDWMASKVWIGVES